jgi:P27 family predicted phage terminase small subunit
MSRNAKPISLSVIEGGKKPHRSNKEIEKRKKAEKKLKPKSDDIDRPDWLKHDTIAQREWRKIVPELKRLDLLSNIDTTALALYCEAVSEYVDAVKQLREEGTTIKYTNTKGETNTIKHPALQVKKDNYQVIKDMLKEFGLTPSARASLAINFEGADNKAEDDEFSDI